jgi:hypothetical protein
LGLATAAALGCLLSACASADAARPATVEPDPGWVLFTELETRLERARTVELHATISSSGAVDADVNADLFLGEGQRARLYVRGTFSGEHVDALYVTDGTQARINRRPPVPAPPDVRLAFVRGLCAMGLLHNAARLVDGHGPDHAEGGVAQFVRGDRPRMADEGLAVAIDVMVHDEQVGEAVLLLDEEGRPRDRTQLVHFGDGDMRVREIYSGVKLDAPLDVGLFVLEPDLAPLKPAAAEPAPAPSDPATTEHDG